MVDLIRTAFEYFGTKTGVLGELRQYRQLWMALLVVWGIAFCFFGVKSYRMVFSLVTFMAITLLICLLMRNVPNWGAVVTTFAIVGFVLAFMAFGWIYVGACVVAGLIAGMTAAMFGAGIAASVIIGALALTITWFFPLPGTIVATVWFGAVVLNESGVVSWLGTSASLAILCVCGLFFQGFLSGRTAEFERKYPEFIRKKVEEKKRRKRIA